VAEVLAVVEVTPPGSDVTVYSVIGLPPSEAGAVHETNALTSSGIADTLVGTSGWAAIGTDIGVGVGVDVGAGAVQGVGVGVDVGAGAVQGVGVGVGVGVAVAIAMPHAPSETVAAGATAADNEEIIKSTGDVAPTENGSDATGLLSVPTLMTCAWMPDT
jgi:hypothetical protein